MKNRLVVVKIGGHVVDDDGALETALAVFSRIKGKKILVHGGGKLATDLAKDLGIPQTLVEGRRVTDKETLKVATLVYGGLVNKNLTARLQALQINAIGMTGADGNLILAKKRKRGEIDYGYVGDIARVNATLLTALLDQGLTPVIAPLTHDGDGQLLNTNADTIAQEIAKALCNHFDVSLVFSFEKTGVLLDIEEDHSVISRLSELRYQELKAEGKVFEGMIPKLDNAFLALKSGVSRVYLGKAEALSDILSGKVGTCLELE